MSIEHKDRKEYRAAYIRKHYQENKQYYKDKAAVRTKAIKALVDGFKSVPCTDCKIQYPVYVMQFDHLGDKEFNIATAARNGYSIKRITEEVAKCEVVCANCHAVRTYSRMVAWRNG